MNGVELLLLSIRSSAVGRWKRRHPKRSPFDWPRSLGENLESKDPNKNLWGRQRDGSMENKDRRLGQRSKHDGWEAVTP